MRKHTARAHFTGTQQHVSPNMPSKTPKQARTTAAAAHDPAFAEKVGIPQDVAQEFNQADAGTGILKHNLQHDQHKEHSRDGR